MPRERNILVEPSGYQAGYRAHNILEILCPGCTQYPVEPSGYIVPWGTQYPVRILRAQGMQYPG